MKHYTEEDKKYILSKITDIKWESITSTLKDFWLDWRDKNEIMKKPNFIWT